MSLENIIYNAMAFYASKGYEKISLPFLCSENAYELTTPFLKGTELYEANRLPVYNNQFLVASAEQSFLDATLQGLIKEDQAYVAWTPCFRPENNPEEYKFPYFTKIELFLWSKIKFHCDKASGSMLEDALKFMSAFQKVTILPTNEGNDIINKNNVELGSYGVRFTEKYGFYWAYGTGVALDRFCLTLKG